MARAAAGRPAPEGDGENAGALHSGIRAMTAAAKRWTRRPAWRRVPNGF